MKLVNIDRFKSVFDKGKYSKGLSVSCEKIIEIIDEIADKYPHVARWEYVRKENGNITRLACSKCGKTWGFEDLPIDGSLPLFKFCPNCGAEMVNYSSWDEVEEQIMKNGKTSFTAREKYTIPWDCAKLAEDTNEKD